MNNRWRESTIGELCEVIAGQSPKGKYYNKNREGLPFYQGKKEFGEKFLGSPEKWTRQITREAVSGDILMSVRAPVGPINFATDNICIGRGLAAIRAGFNLDRNFLFYALLEKQDEICGTEGAVYPSINKAQIQQIELNLPPLPEQERIVAIPDEAFAAIATATANAEKNFANNRELFQYELNRIFTQGGEGWERKTLGQVCSQITDGKHGDCKNEDGSGFYFLSAKDIRDDTLNYENAREITEDDFRETHKRTRLEPGDILVTNAGTIGRTAIAPNNAKTFRTTFQKSVAVLKPIPERMDSLFCLYGLQANLSNLVKLSSGSAQKNLLLRDTRAFEIAMPEEVPRQRKVARQISNHQIKTQCLDSIYKQKLNSYTELKQSILHKAFTGELTADPKSADRTLSEALA